VYCGKRQHEGTDLDDHSGAAAVLRNIGAVLPKVSNDWRVVVTDRFYTSVQLALQLLHRRVYTAGTVMTNRLGLPKSVIASKKTKPKNRSRGDVVMAKAKDYPSMTALSWMDSKPVFFLCTGGSRATVNISKCIGFSLVYSVSNSRMILADRRLRGGEKISVPAPKMVVDYQKWMGGVDVHDQLRLQRYSIQLAMKFKKYYKSIFLGLLDVALVNAYIVWKAHAKAQGFPVPAHDKFLEKLQKQLVELTPEGFAAFKVSSRCWNLQHVVTNL
jgi:hypothetical protein